MRGYAKCDGKARKTQGKMAQQRTRERQEVQYNNSNVNLEMDKTNMQVTEETGKS